MEGVTKIFNYLKSPELVAEFQKRCGVDFSDTDTANENKKIENGTQQSQSDSVRLRNGFSKANGEAGVSDVLKSNGYVKNGYTVDEVIHCQEKNGSVSPNQAHGKEEDEEEDLGKSSFKITNKLYFILFHFGASLGNEIFYLIFFPFVHWNFDGTLMRQMAFIWHVAMWAGQALKDIICWPRPASPPVIKLESRYSLEYGMPSTHATVGTVIPFSLLILLHRYYEIPLVFGFVCATLWMSLVCCSRIYLGMHTVLDVLAGVAFGCLIIPSVLPWVHDLDLLIVTHPLGPLVFVGCYFLFCWVYPKQKIWNTARADTANVHGICGGVTSGYWLFYQLGWLTKSRQIQPYPIPPLTWNWVYLSLLRTVIGVLILAAIRAIVKPMAIHFVCRLYKIDKKDIQAQRREGSEVPQKFITYYFVSIGATFLVPLLCSYLGIMRDSFYHELY